MDTVFFLRRACIVKKCIVVRGGGDLATGVVHALCECGFATIVLECERPSAIRRKVAFCDAVYDKQTTVEGVTACLVPDAQHAVSMISAMEVSHTVSVPVLVDGDCSFLQTAPSFGIEVVALVDAIIAKCNCGTTSTMAPIVVAMGPGFTAPRDCHAVVETMRGHNLGRIITQGEASQNTGIPGIIAGFGKERVIHAPATGVLHIVRDIGSLVSQGETIATIDCPSGSVPVTATLDGVLRGIIHDGYEVTDGLKIADIDPRKEEQKNCFTISDKSRALGNSVLHALLLLAHQKGIALV
ncbi:MAG: EF2563 family selenium-dependent molybdenum hydroxylase system protein [Treponema sp.]|nr:EF2563 family selenium-dependent molybdenum hydroxylase system protein [Treponema sp.]